MDPEAPFSLPSDLTLGPAEVVVADLERSVDYYERVLGLAVHAREEAVARMGGPDAVVLVLHEDRQARPAGRHAGLFHFALLYPSREELARAALRLAAAREPATGASDHRTHEAIYLRDPDGNGIELAADRPRDVWPADLGYAGGPLPLDLDDLVSAAGSGAVPERVEPGLRVGHLHLHVGDIADGVGFYRDALGFTLKADLGTAAFVAAGDYHHHLGINVWQGQGVGPAPDHVAGLRRWTIVLPDTGEVEHLRGRLEDAGIVATAGADGGFEVADPWANVAFFTSEA